MSIIDDRREQMFPTLTAGDIDRLRRFGEIRHFKKGERLFTTGEVPPGMYVLVEGTMSLTRRDPLGRLAPMIEEGVGQFLGEVGQLSGGVAFVDADATSDVEALLIPPASLRAVLIAEADIGERITRALILRRVALIETGAGPVLIGTASSPDVVRLQGFLSRNGYPHQLLDPAEDREAAALVTQAAATGADLPLVACPNGNVLKNPSENELAKCLGMGAANRPGRVYDVAIVGAGPAGLATAVYAASEGLSVITFDSRAFGGQAGASARIENYLGFPTGISGQALTGRAYVQAQKFGVEMGIPVEVVKLECKCMPMVLGLADGRRILSKAVVVASGARYRRPEIPHLADFDGRGVRYWASPIEARMCRDEEVVLVGGGNSAGQAAVFLSGFAKKVWMLVRGPGLAATMSRYLIDRIAATPNIKLLTQTEIVALSGTPEARLERVRWRNRATGEETEKLIRNLFLFVGADPATKWLQDCGVALDRLGYVRTGADLTPEELASDGSAEPMALESNVRGLFAVGDARSGSVKRVGGAIGEGAAVVAQLHGYLARAYPAKEA